MQWLFRKAHMMLIIPTRKLTTIDNIFSIKLSLHHRKNTITFLVFRCRDNDNNISQL